MSKEESEPKRIVYPEIPRTLCSFVAVGSATPHAIRTKIEMVLARAPQSKRAILLFDAYRCSSTLVAAFSAGVAAAVINEKGFDDAGRSLSAATTIAAELGARVVYGGELDGSPIDNGCIGNSPLAATRAGDLCGNVLYFRSTNFGRAWVDLVGAVDRHKAAAVIFVISFENAAATASYISRSGYESYFFASGGFYESISFEDMALGGRMISELRLPTAQLDDEALAMLSSHNLAMSDPRTLTQTWTARVLHQINKGQDVHDILHPELFPEPHRSRMRSTVLRGRLVSGAHALVAEDATRCGSTDNV